MRSESLTILLHCRRTLRRHRRVHDLVPICRSYHHSIISNDSDGAAAARTTPIIDHHIVSNIPKMGRGVVVGQYANTTRTYTSEEVDAFGRLIRDFNPLHSSGGDSWEEEDDLLALQRNALKKNRLIRDKELVHGIFVAGIFSSIFATIAPGCVYVNQDVDFRAPVFCDDTVVGSIHILKVRDWTRRKGGVVAECQTRVYKVDDTRNSQIGPVEAELVINGKANVWLPIGHI